MDGVMRVVKRLGTRFASDELIFGRVETDGTHWYGVVSGLHWLWRSEPQPDESAAEKEARRYGRDAYGAWF